MSGLSYKGGGLACGGRSWRRPKRGGGIEKSIVACFSHCLPWGAGAEASLYDLHTCCYRTLAPFTIPLIFGGSSVVIVYPNAEVVEVEIAVVKLAPL